MFQILIARVADFNVVNKNGDTPLALAAAKGDLNAHKLIQF